VRRLRSDTIAMALSKSTRIMILLAIDTCFFFLELIVGYAVHSLALVADSFHMVCAFHFHMSQTMTNGKLS
jgi:Co/Zn/Cd efflux system component